MKHARLRVYIPTCDCTRRLNKTHDEICDFYKLKGLVKCVVNASKTKVEGLVCDWSLVMFAIFMCSLREVALGSKKGWGGRKGIRYVWQCCTHDLSWSHSKREMKWVERKGSLWYTPWKVLVRNVPKKKIERKKSIYLISCMCFPLKDVMGYLGSTFNSKVLVFWQNPILLLQLNRANVHVDLANKRRWVPLRW